MTLDFTPGLLFGESGPRKGDCTTSIWEKGGEGFGWVRDWGFGMEESFGYRNYGAGVDVGISGASACDDVARLLPPDPFGMGMDSTWNAAIADWIEDLNLECPEGYVVDVGEDCHIDLDFDLYGSMSCNGDEELPCFPETLIEMGKYLYVSKGNDETLSFSSDLDGKSWVFDNQCWDLDGYHKGSIGKGEWLIHMSVGLEEGQHVDFEVEKGEEHLERCSGLPHEGLFFALGYLGLSDLLSIGSVCKTLRAAVVNDPLLWRCIHVGPPLNGRFTDDALLQLTQRAQGGLLCLNLVGCTMITDDGLKHVLLSNQRITKLSVLGCGRLTVEGLLNSLKLFKTPGTPRMENLLIGGIYGAEQSHYEDLKQILDLDNRQKLVRKPRFYRSSLPSHFCDFGCALDMELCPRCNNLRLIYDCPAEACQGKSSEPCRACTLCIARCDNCGRCINDDEYEETFYLDIICSVCMKHLLHSQEEHMYGPLPEKIVSLS